jgi:hypothetical protein
LVFLLNILFFYIFNRFEFFFFYFFAEFYLSIFDFFYFNIFDFFYFNISDFLTNYYLPSIYDNIFLNGTDPSEELQEQIQNAPGGINGPPFQTHIVVDIMLILMNN